MTSYIESLERDEAEGDITRRPDRPGVKDSKGKLMFRPSDIDRWWRDHRIEIELRRVS